MGMLDQRRWRPRRRIAEPVWRRVTEHYGHICFYCGEAVANALDHVVPHGWDADDDVANLRPACFRCNQLAADQHFEDALHKRQWILRRVRQGANRMLYCTGCRLPFTYRVHSPTIFLCAECRDLEYETGRRWARSRGWRDWLQLLGEAGIEVAAHRAIRSRTAGMPIRSMLAMLAEEYERLAREAGEGRAGEAREMQETRRWTM